MITIQKRLNCVCCFVKTSKTTMQVHARTYSDVNTQKPDEFFIHDNFEVNWKKSDSDYQLGKLIGRGGFSDVFEAINLKNDQKCVFKKLKTVKLWRIKREIKILRHLVNGSNIIALQAVVKYDSAHTPAALIFEHINGISLKQMIIYKDLTNHEISFYSYELLKALDFCHKMGVMHRDVKLSNVIVDRKNKKTLKLIDFGLAEFYRPGQDFELSIGTKYYRAPEVLLSYPYYDYSVDMWSFACTFASMVFNKERFFTGQTDLDILLSIVDVLGSSELIKYIEKYQIEMDWFLKHLLKIHPQEVRKPFVNSEDSEVPQEALDFLNELLHYDHYWRMTAREAMAHSYFSSFARN